MTITAALYSGTYSPAVDDTWDDIQAGTEDGVFVFIPTLTNVVAGDLYEFQALEKDAGGTYRVKKGPVTRTGAQTELQPNLLEFLATSDWKIQGRQRAGTAHTVAWRIDQLT